MLVGQGSLAEILVLAFRWLLFLYALYEPFESVIVGFLRGCSIRFCHSNIPFWEDCMFGCQFFIVLILPHLILIFLIVRITDFDSLWDLLVHFLGTRLSHFSNNISITYPGKK